MCALFCRRPWPTAGPLQAHLARSNVNTFPLKRKCPGKPAQRTLVAIWIRRATCGTELVPLKLISRFDFPRSILVRRTTLWWLQARLINGTLAFAFCMITHNTTKFENYVYHPVSTLVFTCDYIPWGLIAKKNEGPLAYWEKYVWILKCYFSTISSPIAAFLVPLSCWHSLVSFWKLTSWKNTGSYSKGRRPGFFENCTGTAFGKKRSSPSKKTSADGLQIHQSWWTWKLRRSGVLVTIPFATNPWIDEGIFFVVHASEWWQ